MRKTGSVEAEDRSTVEGDRFSKLPTCDNLPVHHEDIATKTRDRYVGVTFAIFAEGEGGRGQFREGWASQPRR